MFERYTEKARRSVFFARYEASQFGSPFIESEHLLLGLLRENKFLLNTLIRTDGVVEFESIRKQVEEKGVSREKISNSVDLPISEECKRILTYAAEEADKLSHRSISTEHLFLGVLREQDCFAAKLLRERGVSLETTRDRIGNSPSDQVGRSPKSPGLPAGYTNHKLLYNSAAEILVLQLRASSSFFPARLFLRHKDAEAYEQIGNPADEVSYESPVTCQTLPLVLFNSMKREKTGAKWEGVYSFNLKTKELEVCVSPEKMGFSEPYRRLWIPELVALSENGHVLYADIGIERDSDGVIQYYLAEIDLSDKQVSLLCRLLDTRF